MRAWTFTRRGSPSAVLTLTSSHPEPNPSSLSRNTILIRTSHTALFGPITRLMEVIPHLTSYPWIPSIEFSGTVIATGPETTDFKSGDQIFGMLDGPSYFKYNGALAEYITTPCNSIAICPASATLAESAGLAGAGCTIIGICERAGLLEVERSSKGDLQIKSQGKGRGKRVLVTGGATATGIFLLQLVKHLVGPDGEVVTTASPRNKTAVESYGADRVIDYTDQPFLSSVLERDYSIRKFDIIIDIAGSDPTLYPHSPQYLAENGCFVFAGSMGVTHANPGSGVWENTAWVATMAGKVLSWAVASIRPVVLGGVPRRTFFHSGNVTRRNLELTRRLVEDRVLKCVVDGVWEMEDAVSAFEHLMGAKIRGKVVVKVEKL